MLQVEAVVDQIDVDKICRFEGPATIVVSNYTVGEGPARRWYSVVLEKVIARGAPRLLDCRHHP